MILNETFETPKTLASVLEKRPSTKSELLTYVASWKEYCDFLLSQAKACKDLPHHPLNTEDGQTKFVTEVSRFQETYNQVAADVSTKRFHLTGDEMRRIGDQFTAGTQVIEQAFAIHQVA